MERRHRHRARRERGRRDLLARAGDDARDPQPDGIVVVDDESGMRGIDTATGDVLWENEEAPLTSSSPDSVLAGGQLYAAIDTRVVGVIDIATGEIVDRIDADLGSGGANANNRWAATLVAWDGKVIVIDSGGELIAYG